MTAQLLNGAPCCIFSFSDEGILVAANDTLLTTLGFSENEVMGKHVENLLSLPSRIFFQTHLFPLVKLQGNAEEIFMTLRDKEGQQLPMLLNARRADFNGDVVTTCAAIGVPNRKKYEDELLNARKAAEKALHENAELMATRAELQKHAEELEQQMKLVEIQNYDLQQFSHAATHNLKEPLRKVLLYTAKVQAVHSSPDAEKLGKAARQMEKVLSGVQEYVWLTEKNTRFESVDLKSVIDGAVQKLKEELETAPPLQLETGHLDTVSGDAEQLQLLFYHLLKNAVQFRRGPVAKVLIQSVILKQNQFRSLGNRYRYNDHVRIEIIDEGIGFDEMFSEQIFGLFQKLHVSDSLGLGLALCRAIVDNHNGLIKAEANVNQFSKFTIWLPLQQE